MSACSDFAEHVWKPGSCKNCFHPLSAHKTVGGLDGSLPAACLKSSLGGDEEAGVTTPSPYSKPTIAVKPTMMSLDTNESTDVNMNIEQVNFLNVSFLYQTVLFLSVWISVSVFNMCLCLCDRRTRRAQLSIWA